MNTHVPASSKSKGPNRKPIPPVNGSVLSQVPERVVEIRNGLTRFKDCTPSMLAMIDRLLTDLNMVPVWEAVKGSKADPRLPADFLNEVRSQHIRWRQKSKLANNDLEAEVGKMARKAKQLARMLRTNEAEILQGRGILELGPLIRLSQGHDYLPLRKTQSVKDSQEQELRDWATSDRICPMCHRPAAPCDPLTGDETNFNPLPTVADVYLPEVADLLAALGTWLETPSMREPDRLRPTKVGAKSAERTFMARVLSAFFKHRLGKPHHELVATTVRVALNLPEDDKFRADHVRKAAA